jgi:predicted glycosyltransferase
MTPGDTEPGPKPLRVWIDLSNSPHPLLFAPIARALEQRGHIVLITARDHAQTVELAQSSGLTVEVIGGESPGGRARKASALGARIVALRRWARRARPDVALSHNSYAQIVAARSAGIPAVTAMDFEHQPANNVAFRLAARVLIPEALPPDAVRRQGATAKKTVRYPGLKEAIYVGDFDPDASVVADLGIDRGPNTALVVVRTPPSRALYHRFENPLFARVLERMEQETDAHFVVLPRHPEQRLEIVERRLANVTLPATPVESRSLIYEADLVIGAGGTMTREAALMGVPTLSVYAGAQPAVDAWLEATGALRRINAIEQIGAIQRRASEPKPLDELRHLGDPAIERFVRTVEAAVS